MSLRIFVA
jgi:hypothetical protein